MLLNRRYLVALMDIVHEANLAKVDQLASSASFADVFHRFFRMNSAFSRYILEFIDRKCAAYVIPALLRLDMCLEAFHTEEFV